MAKVTVILPNYNHQPFLQERLDSIFNQEFQDFEVVIFDDASTDESRVFLQTYATHPKVKALVFNEKNSGSTFKQWQKAKAYIDSEFVWIAESDDKAAPTFLGTLVHALEENPTAGVAYAQSFRINEKGEEFTDFRQWKEPHWPKIFYVDGKDMILNHFLKGRAIPNASSAVFRASAWPKDETFTTMRYSGDIMFWLNILLSKGIVVVNQRLNYFRKHSKNVSTKASAIGWELHEALDVLFWLSNRLKLPNEVKAFRMAGLVETWWRNQLFPHKRMAWWAWVRVFGRFMVFYPAALRILASQLWQVIIQKFK